MSTEREHPDAFPNVQAAIDSLTSDLERTVCLIRLVAKLNNGDKHFDHNVEHGYSWLCLRCARDGRGGLNGWAGAFHFMNEEAKAQEGKS